MDARFARAFCLAHLIGSDRNNIFVVFFLLRKTFSLSQNARLLVMFAFKFNTVSHVWPAPKTNYIYDI